MTNMKSMKVYLSYQGVKKMPRNAEHCKIEDYLKVQHLAFSHGLKYCFSIVYIKKGCMAKVTGALLITKIFAGLIPEDLI